jgi:hypothetical protein
MLRRRDPEPPLTSTLALNSADPATDNTPKPSSPIPTDRNTLLTRVKLSEAFSALGIPVATASLASMVTRGNGPPYRKFGQVALYRWGDALDWAESRLSTPRRSSSEGDAAAKEHERSPGTEPVRGCLQPDVSDLKRR